MIGVPVHVCLALAVISALCMSGVYIDLPYLMAEIRMEVRHLARACIHGSVYSVSVTCPLQGQHHGKVSDRNDRKNKPQK